MAHLFGAETGLLLNTVRSRADAVNVKPQNRNVERTTATVGRSSSLRACADPINCMDPCGADHITAELDRRTSQLEQVAQRQREFVTTASHELRTPLTTIMGYLELVLDLSATLGDEDREHLLVALHASHRLSTIVDDLVTAHRLRSEELMVQPANVALGDTLKGGLEAYASTCERRGVRLTADLAHADELVMADCSATVQAFKHLLSNAVKFTASGGTVRLHSHVDDQAVHVSIADTGMGIPAAEIEHVFEPFFRGSNVIAAAISGTGLGLTIAKALITAQGGTITVDSRLGGGTTVTVSFVPQAPRNATRSAIG